jgi:subtilisin-like proprotein convertase family protein
MIAMTTHLKYCLATGAVAWLAWTAPSLAQTPVTNSFFASPNLPVPDGDPNGLALVSHVSGLQGTLTGLTVSLHLTGGNNTDLFAYLTGPNGGFAILLNRVGINAGNSFGYQDTGFNVVLSDDALCNIHNYQTAPGFELADGALTGAWAPDGRNIDPQSAPAAFDFADADATFGSFEGTDPNGIWTLFLADLSGAEQSTVQSWGLNITTVPEPGTITLLGLAVALVAARKRRASAP